MWKNCQYFSFGFTTKKIKNIIIFEILIIMVTFVIIYMEDDDKKEKCLIMKFIK